MYTIYAAGANGTETVLFSDTMPDSAPAVSPRLTLTAGAAGSLTLTLPKTNAAHDSVERLTTTMRVERDGETIWMGRVLSEKTDIWHSRAIFCEGAQAWLNDILMPTAERTGSAATLMDAVLGVYNQKAAANRQIARGECTVTGSLTLSTDYGSALEAVNKLVSDYGGVLRMRHPNNIPTLDWLADYPAIAGGEQPLQFGENLLDFTRSWDLADFATVCYVRGGEIEGTDPAQTAFGSYTLTAAQTRYGTIEKFLSYTDLLTNAACTMAAKDYLERQQYDGMTLEVTALDLHILRPDVRAWDICQRVPVQAAMYGLEDPFAVTGMEIPLDAPEQTRYTLGPANTPYVRRVNTITKVTQANQQAAIEYADTAADGALSAANDHTDAVKVVLEAKDTEIEASVTAADGRASQALITADEIKGKVTDAQGNYTVANLKADGFYIADAQGRTLITGTMIDVDTIHVNQLYGGTIYLNDAYGAQAGSFYVEAAGGLNPSALRINFEDVWMDQVASVNLPDISFIYVYNNGQRVSLRTLLGL